LEEAGAHEEGLTGHKLLGHARPDDQRARKLFPLHEVLHRERRDDVDGLPRIVALAMPRSPFDQRLAIGDAGLLRGFWKAIDIAAERNDRTAGAPARDPGGGYARHAPLDGETVLFEQPGQIFRGLEFLVGELAEAEDGVVYDLRELAPLLDAVDHDRLEFFDPPDVVFRSGGVLRAGGTPRKQKHNERQSRHGLNFHRVPTEHRDLHEKNWRVAPFAGFRLACLRDRVSDRYERKV